jgi:hypothetical protein
VTINGTMDKADDQDDGYVVEAMIPWKSFDKAKKVPPELGQSWRINLYAMENNGGMAWSAILGQGNFHRASRFGKVLFAAKGWAPPAPSAAPPGSGAPAGSGAPPAAAPAASAAAKAPPPPAAPSAKP